MKHGLAAALCRWFMVLSFAAPAAAAPLAVIRLTHDGEFKQRPAWSPDGKLLVYAQHTATKIELMLADADGSNPRRLTKAEQPQYDASWSPDGKQLAICHVKQSPGQGDVDVHVIGLDGGEPQPVAVNGPTLSHEESPAWSPDGKRIAYSTTRDGNQEIYVVTLDGLEHKRLTSDQALDAHPAWSPDGKRIAFATARWGGLEIAVTPTEGGDVERLTTSRGLDDYPAWSPDGRTLAFTSNRDGNFEIYVLDLATQALENVTQNSALDNFPAWTPAGDLGFVSDRDDGFDVYVIKMGR